MLLERQNSKTNETFLNNVNVLESCTRERVNTVWKFYKLTNATLFAFKLKEVPMGCKNAVLSEKLCFGINCWTFQENTRKPYNIILCLFRAVALFLHGRDETERDFIAALSREHERRWCSPIPISLYEQLSNRWRLERIQHFSVQNCYCGWSSCWRTCEKKHRKKSQKCEVVTLQ